MSTTFPAPPPPPPPQQQHHHHRASHHHLHEPPAPQHHASHHGHHHHGHHNHLSDHSDSSPSRDSMANLVGTSHFRQHAWRSRSSPPVAHRGLRNWTQHAASQGELNFAYRNRDRSPPGQPVPRTFLHSSFHDLHAANENRASRQDLRELREMLRNQGGPEMHRASIRSSRRSMHERKWPPVPGSPNACRRCIDGLHHHGLSRY